MEKRDILVRGIHGGVLIILPDLPWYQQRDMLISRIQTQERFFKGGRIALNVGSTDWTEEQLQKLLKDMSDEGVCLWAVLSESSQTVAAAEYHGFPTSLPDPRRGKDKSIEEESAERADYFCISRSLLKGESLQREGNLILLGDVLNGSSLSVKGNLIVWGTVSGKISVESEQTDVFIKFIKFDDGEISMNGKPVEIAGKQQKNLEFEINLIDGEIQVHSNRSGGFNLL